MFHSAKFYNFILERGGAVTLEAIDQPPADWSSPLTVFEETMRHEQKVTGLINDLVALARGENDNASEIFLQWFPQAPLNWVSISEIWIFAFSWVIPVRSYRPCSEAEGLDEADRTPR